jgi:hypothetical protein
MKDKIVEVILQTPLWTSNVKEEPWKSLGGAVLRVSGKSIEETTAGILLQVQSVASEKNTETKLPFSKIFIPYHKIDHIILKD